MNFKRIISIGLIACTLSMGSGTVFAAENVTAEDINSASSVESDSEVQIKLDGTYDYVKAYELLNEINSRRKAAGISELTMDIDLLKGAKQRAAECNLYYSHKRPDGSSYIGLAGDGYGIIAENIAENKQSAQQVTEAWSVRRGDNGSMMNENFTSVGIGCFYQKGGSVFWSAIFTDKTANQAVQPKNEDTSVNIDVLPSNLGIGQLIASAEKIAPKETAQTVLYVNNKGIEAVQDGKPSDNSFLPPIDLIDFKSSDTDIAKVDKNGLVTGIADGKVTVSASVKGTSAIGKTQITVKTPFGHRVPQNVTALNRSKGIRIDWDEIAGSKLYIVYRSENGGNFKQIAQISKNTYTDKKVQNGTQYQYKIVASTGKTRTRESEPISICRLSSISIASIAASGENAVKVKWTPNTKADGYEVEYLEKDSDKPVTVKVSGGTRKILTIKKLKSDTQYTVRMRSYATDDEDTYYSGWSVGRIISTSQTEE